MAEKKNAGYLLMDVRLMWGFRGAAWVIGAVDAWKQPALHNAIAMALPMAISSPLCKEEVEQKKTEAPASLSPSFTPKPSARPSAPGFEQRTRSQGLIPSEILGA